MTQETLDDVLEDYRSSIHPFHNDVNAEIWNKQQRLRILNALRYEDKIRDNAMLEIANLEQQCALNAGKKKWI